MNRVWAMPNKWTFKIKPVAELLNRYNVGEGWADPFCGTSQLCEFRNDLNRDNTVAITHLDCEEFAEKIVPQNIMGIVFDPPYSLHNVMQFYRSVGKEHLMRKNPTGAYPKTRDILASKICKDGISISFGYNSVGLGKKRGFEIIEILLISHGRNRNDTIVTVERKL